MQQLSETFDNILLHDNEKSSHPKMIINNGMYHVIVEGEEIGQCPEFIDAMTLIVCSYYIFNIEYAPKFKSTLTFVSRFIFKIKEDTPLKDKKVAKLSLLLDL